MSLSFTCLLAVLSLIEMSTLLGIGTMPVAAAQLFVATMAATRQRAHTRGRSPR